MIAIVVLIIAVNIDSFFIGVSYGLRKYEDFYKLLLVAPPCGVLLMTVSYFGGEYLKVAFFEDWGSLVSGIIFFLLGLWLLISHFTHRYDHTSSKDLRKDMTWKEAFILALVLGVDAFVAGIGVGLAGFGYIVIPLVGLGTVVSMFKGYWLGSRDILTQVQYRDLIAAVILILLGISRVFV